MSASDDESVVVDGQPTFNSYENGDGDLVIYHIDNAGSEWVRAGNPWEVRR